MKQLYTVKQIKQNRYYFSFHKYMMLDYELECLLEQFQKEYNKFNVDSTADNVINMNKVYVTELGRFVREIEQALKDY